MTCSQNDGYHVGSTFPSASVVENLVKHGGAILLTFDYDVKVVISLLMVWYDRLNPNANASNVVIVDVAKLDLEKKVWCGGLNWIKMLLDHNSHHKITFKEKLLEINPRMEFQF